MLLLYAVSPDVQMVKTRLWRDGEVSAQRDLPLLRRLTKRVRRSVARRPLLLCPDGWVSYSRAMREPWRHPLPTGQGGWPRLRPWRQIWLAQVVKRDARRRVVATDRHRVAGPLARHPLTLEEGMCLVGTVDNVCTPHESLSQAQKTPPAMAAGSTDHGWTRHARLSFHVPLSRWVPPKRRGRPARTRQRLIERWCS